MATYVKYINNRWFFPLCILCYSLQFKQCLQSSHTSTIKASKLLDGAERIKWSDSYWGFHSISVDIFLSFEVRHMYGEIDPITSNYLAASM